MVHTSITAALTNIPNFIKCPQKRKTLQRPLLFILSSKRKNAVHLQPPKQLWTSHLMADHDRRREAMKRHKSQSREVLHADQEKGLVRSHERVVGEIREGEIDGDLAAVVHDLSYKCPQACTAKAA
ncbi:hypothetical protein RJ639_031318 [Escallonia herrerae]|uniref:Uncharacterized protein n=1 Tax=Escallonia herrerae TaxID=1293975 RepID=A0AA89BCJ3_9ASTE|nr:hypothetical protein RJ639_031318 [Escallonia herrerae]